MVLIVSNKLDTTCDFVVRDLKNNGVDFCRFNTEDFLSDWKWKWTSSGWTATSPSRSFRNEDVSAVYYRRPRQPIPRPGTARVAASFAVREAGVALDELLSSLNCLWVSPREAIAKAENKLFQLRLATELGFVVPQTLVTNNASDIIDMMADGPLIVKPLFNGWLLDEPPTVAFTNYISANDVHADEIASCPHLVQRKISKVADLRVTVVDSTAFACRIASQAHPETSIDFRTASQHGLDLEHTVATIPGELAERCVRLTKSLGLKFGALDFVETESGFVFLEINPNGQWAWIEQLTRMPIARAIGDLLAAGSR